jgi:hypothetical protein
MQVPEAAMSFLEGLSSQLKPIADQEVEELRKMKALDLSYTGEDILATQHLANAYIESMCQQ